MRKMRRERGEEEQEEGGEQETVSLLPGHGTLIKHWSAGS